MANYRAARKTTIYQATTNLYEVLCIGLDENQSGINYGSGIWDDFIFTVIPVPSAAINDWVTANNYAGNLHLIDKTNNSIRVKTTTELGLE